MCKFGVSISIAMAALTMVATAASAQTTLKVDGSTGAMPLVAALAKAYEAKTPNLTIEIGKGLGTKARIDTLNAGSIDIAVASHGLKIDDLVKQGKLAAATRSDIAKSGAGVAIRKGAPKPDIATADAFKRALLAAKSIAYVGQGATGANMRKIFERLGIADEMKAKTRILSGISAADAVARGEAELGFTQVSEILPVAGAELAGPLPPEVQIYTVFPAAVGAGAKEPAAA